MKSDCHVLPSSRRPSCLLVPSRASMRVALSPSCSRHLVAITADYGASQVPGLGGRLLLGSCQPAEDAALLHRCHDACHTHRSLRLLVPAASSLPVVVWDM